VLTQYNSEYKGIVGINVKNLHAPLEKAFLKRYGFILLYFNLRK
jgi:hypothetical protein